MPAPQPKRPGLLARIGHGAANALFPVAPMYRGLLSEEEQNAAQSQGLMQLGMNLLSQSGPSAQPVGTGQAIGRAHQAVNWPEMLAGHTQTLAALQDHEKKMALDSRRAQIIQRFPAQQGETPQQTGARLMRMLPHFIEIGDTETAGKITELLKTMGMGDASQQGTPHAGINPATGKPELFLVDRAGNKRWLGVAPTERTGQEQLQDQRMFQRERDLANEYSRDVKPWLVPYVALQRANRYTDRAAQGDGAAQLQMLYAFIQTLDNSVVKEGEAAMFMRAAPILDRAKAFANKYAHNRSAVIPPGLVEEMTGILNDVTQAFEDRFTGYREHYTQRAKRWGVDPSSFIDIPSTFRMGAPGAAPTPGGSATDSLRAQFPRR